MVWRERRMWKRCKGVLWRELLGDDDVMVVNRGQGKGEWGRGIGEDLIFIVWIGATAFPSSDQTKTRPAYPPKTPCPPPSPSPPLPHSF